MEAPMPEYWLAGIQHSLRDQILERVQSTILTGYNAKAKATNAAPAARVGGRVFRRNAYIPFLGGVVLPCVIVAPFSGVLEEQRPSAVIRGQLNIGIMVEHEQFAPTIDQGEASVDSYLEELQSLIDGNPLLYLPGEESLPVPCNIVRHAWQGIEPAAQLVAGGQVTCYAGLVLSIFYKDSYTSRSDQRAA
jgi:hypothetical protein